jgi:DNA-binding SARP family transcriptional activator/TolB-like protein
VIRRALGDAAVATLGDDVRLDDTQVRVDVRDFERAVDAGALEDAVTLYTGPFLDGFHLTDAAEFERWVDDERSRLAGRLAHTLRALASAAERQNDFRGAAEWLRRLAALDPLDTHVALRLMDALERAGHGAAALRHARVHQALRHAELELGEDSAIRAAADALVARLEAATIASPSVSHSKNDREASRGDEKTLDEPAPPSSSRARRRRLGARHVVGAALAVATLTLAGRWAMTARSTTARAADTAGPTGVAVFPFVVRGEGTADIPGDAMAVLLATKLDGGVGWRSIDPNALFAQYRSGPEHPDPADAARLARRLGADYFVLGDIVRVGPSVNLGAALYDARTGAPVFSRVGAQGASSALFALVDSLAARVLVGRSGEPVPQLARLASLTTGSLPALKEYLAGEAQVRAGRYADAAETFQRAIVADSTFALAYYRLAGAYGWSGRASDKGTPLRMAARYGARLPEQIRLTVAAGLAVDSGNVSEAERMLRMVVARHPDGVDANYELGELLFHANPSRGISGAEAREPLERAVMLDPSRSAEPLFHLATIAALDGRARDVDSLITRLLQLHPEGSMSAAMRPTVALLRHDSSGIDQAARELAQLPTALALRNASLAIGMTNDPLGGARLLAALDRPSRPANDRARVVIALARLAAGRGDWVTADSLFARARTMDAPAAIDARARLLSLPIGDPPTESVRSARADVLRGREASQPRYRLLAGLLAARLGEVRTAQATANELARVSPNDRPNRALWAELAARCFLAQRRGQEALAILEGIRVPGPPLRFLRGEVLESLGRNDEALRWYEVAAQDYGGELYASVIAKARARLAAARVRSD